MVHKWFTSGLQVVHKWFTNDLGWFTSGSQVVYKWFTSDLGWFTSGLQVVHKWFTSDLGWFTSGLQVVHKWFTNDQKVHRRLLGTNRSWSSVRKNRKFVRWVRNRKIVHATHAHTISGASVKVLVIFDVSFEKFEKSCHGSKFQNSPTTQPHTRFPHHSWRFGEFPMTGSKNSKIRNFTRNLEIRTRHGRTKGFHHIRDGFATIGVTIAKIDKTHGNTTQHSTVTHKGRKLRL